MRKSIFAFILFVIYGIDCYALNDQPKANQDRQKSVNFSNANSNENNGKRKSTANSVENLRNEDETKNGQQKTTSTEQTNKSTTKKTCNKCCQSQMLSPSVLVGMDQFIRENQFEDRTKNMLFVRWVEGKNKERTKNQIKQLEH